MRNYKKKTQPKYSQDALQKAIQDVKSGKCNSYQASKLYNIPRTTIVDRITKRRGAVKQTRGRPTAIDRENEERLAVGLRTMEKYGFGLSAKETMVIVTKYVRNRNLTAHFSDRGPGYDWLAGFMKRNGLSLKKPQAVEMSRKAACDPFIIKQYFDVLEGCFKDLNLYMHPEKIWNLDESSLSMDPEKTKVLGGRCFASTRTIAATGKDNVTVLFAANAVGEKLPPMIVFRGKNVWDQWMSPKDFPGTKYAATKNGWMESDIFEKYMLETVFPNICDDPPALIIYDGHSTHIQLSIVEKAAELGITIIKLPSHTSHLLQPLDLAVFKSLKDKWDLKILAWQRLNIGKKLPKAEFSQIVGEVWQELEPKTIRNGFKKGGVYPLDKTVISDDKYDLESLKRFNTVRQENNTNASNLPSLITLCLRLINKKDEIRQNQSKLQNRIMKPSDICVPGTSTGTSKIQIIEDKVVNNSGIDSFESLLLATLRKGDTSINPKKRKVAKGCEVITKEHYIEMLRKETEAKNKKAQDIQDKQIKKNNCIEMKAKNNQSSKKTQPQKKQAQKKQQDLNEITNDRSGTKQKGKQTRQNRKQGKKISHKKKEYSDESSDSGDITDIILDDDDSYEDNQPSKKKQPKRKQDQKKQQGLDDSSSERSGTKQKGKQTRLNRKQGKITIHKKKEYSDESSDSDMFILDNDDFYEDLNRQNVQQNVKEFSDSDHEMEQAPQKRGSVPDAELEQYESDAPPTRIQIDNWVVVKFTTKKTVKHFIGKVISIDANRIPTVKFLRKNRNSKIQSFHYPDVEDISYIKHEEDIVMTLVDPQITRRGQVIFTDDLVDFNIQ